jgi:hypothetical protein
METVLLAREADERSMIEDREFTNALILGPAVVSFVEDVSFVNNAIRVDPDAFFLEISAGRNVSGIIGLRRVTIKDCVIQNVSIAGPPHTIAELRERFLPQTAQGAPAPGGRPDPSSP